MSKKGKEGGRDGRKRGREGWEGEYLVMVSMRHTLSSSEVSQ